jgi:1-acyl-sn-glycerol-3-phosphate acyltransferase
LQWQQLESNPVTKLLFRQCGFIPVQMAANEAGEANDYDVKSFKNMLKSVKQAFVEGFDIGILPEGQLNPYPEQGLRPCFSGAFTLAKFSKRPIHMMALNGCHKLWHPRADIGMTVTGRTIKARVYEGGRRYATSHEFLETFQAVVGYFGAKGRDMPEPELQRWLEGTEYQNRKA